MQIVFSVADNPTQDPLITKVDLTVNELWASEPNPATGYAQDGREFILVSNGLVNEDKHNDEVLVSKLTSLTQANYVEPTYPPTTQDDSTADSAEVTEPTTVPETTVEPSVMPTEPTVPTDDSVSDGVWEPMVKTGRKLVACIILCIVSGAATVLFILRKREFYK